MKLLYLWFRFSTFAKCKPIFGNSKNISHLKIYFLLFFFIHLGNVQAQQEITVGGHVTNNPFGYDLAGIKVLLQSKNTLDTLTIKYTNASGSWSANLFLTGIENEKLIPQTYGISAFPNPYNPSAHIVFQTPVEGTYSIKKFNVLGKELAGLQVHLYPGQYSFEVTGKSQGVEFFQITGENYSKTYKLINLGGTGSDKIRLEGNSAYSLDKDKRGINKHTSADSILITYTDTTGVRGTVIKTVPFADGFYEVQMNEFPKNSVTFYIGHITLLPSGADGMFLQVLVQDADTQDTLKISTSDNLGMWQAFFPYNYWNYETDTLYENANIKLTISGDNVIPKDTIFAFIPNLQWQAYVQQATGQGTAHGNGHLTLTPSGNNGAGLNMVFKNKETGQQLSQTNTNTSGNYTTTFPYSFYVTGNDTTFSIDSVQINVTGNEVEPKDTTIAFTPNFNVNMNIQQVLPAPYHFVATINLRTTNQGQFATGIDTLFVLYQKNNPDSVHKYVPVNGVVSIDDHIYNMDADSTAEIWHNHPESYLRWTIGHKVNPEHTDWLFQNASFDVNADMPVPAVNEAGTIELYLVPKIANYGPNNDIPLDMMSSTVRGFFHRVTYPLISGFRPSPAGWDTTAILRLTFNLDTGNPIDPTNLARAQNELEKFLTATIWNNTKLLNYKVIDINSLTDPNLLAIINPPRSGDNYTYTGFENAGPGNAIQIANDGTYRIINSSSTYSTGSSNGNIQEEILASMTNTVFDGLTYFWDSNQNYSDVAKNIIGICYIIQPGTAYDYTPESHLKPNKDIIR